VTLTFKLDPDRVKVKQHTKYLGQTSFCSKVTVHTHRHAWNRVLCLDL